MICQEIRETDFYKQVKEGLDKVLTEFKEKVVDKAEEKQADGQMSTAESYYEAIKEAGTELVQDFTTPDAERAQTVQPSAEQPAPEPVKSESTKQTKDVKAADQLNKSQPKKDRGAEAENAFGYMLNNNSSEAGYSFAE